MAKKRQDFKVYEERSGVGKTLWRIRSGGCNGDVATNCKTQLEAECIANELNKDPWFLHRGDTRRERNM
jgi:hypothetical protein